MNKLPQPWHRNIKAKTARFFSAEFGATTVEYAIMLGLIIMVCFVAIQFVGSETAATWTSNSQEISNATNP